MWGFEEEFDNDDIVLQQKRNDAFSSNNQVEEVNAITHQPVRSRGRIAEVLAQARASLKEPSRPFTPASLDARTSHIKQPPGISADQARLQSSSLYGHVYGAINKTKQKQNNQDNYQAQPLKAASSALLNSSTVLLNSSIVQNINDTSNKLSLSHTPQDENAYNYNDFSSYSNLSPEKKNTSSNQNNNNGQGLQIVILDLQDNITLLETATLPNSLVYNNENESNLNKILNNLSPSIEKISKSLKGGVVLSQKIHSDLNLCISETARLLTRVVQSQSMIGSIKQLACRHILRLYLSKVARITSMGVDSGVQPTIPSDVSSVILSTLQSMYQMCGTNDIEDSNINAYEPDANNDGIYEIDDENQSSIVLSMPSSSSKNDVMLSGGIDIILDLLSQIWSRLPNDFKREVDSDQTNGQGFMILLESAVYAAGILRIYSNDETNRRRLLHLGAVESIGEGLKVSGIIANYRLQLESQSIKLQTPSISSSSRMINIFDKLSQILVQLVAAERNFSLDSQGRLQIQISKSICVICNLFRLYKSSPELLLNCARVTAKLSLQEPFRSQINSKSVHIKCLVGVIIGEAQHCQKIMDGDHSNLEEDVDNTIWPSWYTWPLLSRISFTLGNLTTTNDSNRTLIGIECKVLKPLVVLLRACAGSLTLLYAPKNVSDDENSNCDNEYENEDNASKQSTGEQELSDATVKLLRLLANLCIDGTIGVALAKRGEAMEMLVELLTCSSLSNEHEELLLNVVATATNLSFYACQPNVILSDPNKQDNIDLNRLERGLVSLTKKLANSLFHENDEVVLEASRALGNLTRSPVALISLRQSRTDEALVLLLSHSNMDIVTAVTGALINVSSGRASRRSLLSRINPMVSLTNVLKRSSLKNISLSLLICQVLYNLLLQDNTSNDINETNTSQVTNEQVLSSIPPSLSLALTELVECAIDMDEVIDNKSSSAQKSSKKISKSSNDTGRYTEFIRVGQAVLNVVRKSSM